MGDQDHIKENLFAYVQGFSPSVKDIFECFGFHTQVDRLSKAGLLEAIVGLPTDMFYNTGISTYVWIVSNRKPAHQKGNLCSICLIGGTSGSSKYRSRGNASSKLRPELPIPEWKVNQESNRYSIPPTTRKATNETRHGAVARTPDRPDRRCGHRQDKRARVARNEAFMIRFCSCRCILGFIESSSQPFHGDFQ